MEENGLSEIRIKLSGNLKKDLDTLAKAKGTSTGVLAKKILKLYVREEYYKKAQEILNIEGRVSTAVVLGLHPEIEEMRREIDEIKDIMLKSSTKQGENLYKRQSAPPKEEEEKKKEKMKLPPPIAGLNYTIKGDYAYCDDGSLWNLKIGAWIVRGDKVMRWKRKRDEELGL